MGSKLIQVTNTNFREANKEVVLEIIKQLNLDLKDDTAIIEGMKVEQPCRMELVPID